MHKVIELAILVGAHQIYASRSCLSEGSTSTESLLRIKLLYVCIRYSRHVHIIVEGIISTGQILTPPNAGMMLFLPLKSHALPRGYKTNYQKWRTVEQWLAAVARVPMAKKCIHY
ncbi:hypothetical protein BDR04DRAFT_1098581 [Suillus decipiens]|nr:hypothetical protein BDR04DRAFT_1098581 [Suillus decipiens]